MPNRSRPIQASNSLDNSRYVAITLDDGHVSFLENVLPELEKRNIPSTLFVVSAKLGESPDWANYSPEPLYQ